MSMLLLCGTVHHHILSDIGDRCRYYFDQMDPRLGQTQGKTPMTYLLC